MAYSDSFPATRPVFQADFANGGRVDPRITFSRPDSPINSSNAPASAVHYWSNEKHLSSENLIKHSEGTAVWGGTSTVTYNYTNGPDGVTGTALRLESASGTERYRYSTGGQFVSGTAYTVSCWVKSNTGVAQTFRFMCSTTANQSTNLTTHATDWTRVTATITPNTTNIFAGFVFLSANTNDISVWGLQVNTGSNALDYQATTTQIHREYAPTLKSVSTAGQPRFEYSPTDSAPMGLLVEGSSTNLNAQSADASNWNSSTGGVALNIQTNSAIAPDGTLTADNLVTTDVTAYIQLYFSATSGQQYTHSFFAKAAGQNYITAFGRAANGTFDSEIVRFDLANGTVLATTGTATGAIESCGNGWFRCSATMTAGATATGYQRVYVSDSSSLNNTPDSYSGVLFWGSQVEAGHMSSLILTSGSQLSRAADSAAMVSSSLFDTGSGAIICELGPVAGTVYPTAFALTDSSTQNIVRCQGNNGATQMSLVVNSDNSGVATITQSFTPTGTKLGVSYDTNSFKLCTDGGTVDSDTAGQVPEGLNRLEIGGDTYSSSSLNGHVKRVAVYPALTDTNLQALTS